MTNALKIGMIIACGALLLTKACSSPAAEKSREPKQTAVIVGDRTYLAQVYRRNGGLCGELPNGERAYNFGFASEARSSMTLGNILYRVSTK
jgi:hypothetical protein